MSRDFPRAAVDAPEALSRESLQRHHRLLLEIVSQTGGTVEKQLRHALACATELLDLDRGLLARAGASAFVVEECHDPGGSLEAGTTLDTGGRPGDETRIEKTNGSRYYSLIKERGLVAFDRLADAPDARLRRCYTPFALESCLGTPVWAGERFYGVLAFSGAAPREPSFSSADEHLVRLLGTWMSALLARRERERGHRQGEAWLRLLADNVSDMVCLHRLSGECLYVSPSAQRLLGYPPEALVGTFALEHAHPDDVKRIQAAAARALRGEADVVQRSRLRHADGSYRWCETAGHPVYDADGETVLHFLTSTRDIGERVEAEAQLQRTNAELRLRNRELEDFAHIASHDLQEPLRKVRAFADLMREDYDDEVDEDGRYYLERMQDGAARMSRLVNDLLSLSRVTTSGHPFEPVDLAEIVPVVCTDLEMRIEETDGSVQLGPLPLLDADPTQMRQLLQNLVSNALKFHREDVPPVVQVHGAREPVEEHEEHADKLAAGTTEVCRIVVEDNGIGFEEKFLDRIFTPLQRLHGQGTYEGTGIGLAVCRRIAERHGGLLWAESTVGTGSRFTVLLPATQTGDASSVNVSSGDGRLGEPVAENVSP